MAGIPGKITFNVLNLEPIKELAEILNQIIEDGRIPVDIRDEYVGQLNAIDWKYEVSP